MLDAVLPGRARPSWRKGNALLTSRETLSFQPPADGRSITSRRLAAAMQRQVGGDASAQSRRLGVARPGPNATPTLLAVPANVGNSSSKTVVTVQAQPWPTRGCRSKSAVCCDSGLRSGWARAPSFWRDVRDIGSGAGAELGGVLGEGGVAEVVQRLDCLVPTQWVGEPGGADQGGGPAS